MERAFSRKVRLEKLHLVTQDAPTLKVDVFGVRRHEGNSQQLHAGLFRCSAGFVVVAAFASGNNVSPKIEPPLTQGFDMIPR